MHRVSLGGIGALILLLLSSSALALDCLPADFDRQVKQAKNVLVGEVQKEVKRPGMKGHFVVRIVKILKNGGLFKANQRTFQFPKTTGWDTFRYKTGQLLLFFFPARLSVLCNHPIPIK